jgi:SulP family sulfate permease
MNAIVMNNNWRWLLPFLNWMPHIKKDALRADVLAALAGAIVVLPQGVAFAAIAGMPPQYGLYAGMVPAVIAALFGSSRHLVSGPTTAASVVLFSALSAFAPPGSEDYVRLALTLTFMVGVFQLALGLARMGALVNFISHSVIIGFTAGAAILIGAKQLSNFFGISLHGAGHIHEIFYQVFSQLDKIDMAATTVAIVTLVSGIAVKRWLPKIPYMIVAMIIGSLLAFAFNSNWLADGAHITTVGALPATLPPMSAPDLTMQTIKDLAPAALALTLFALTEAVSIGRSLAARGGYRIDGNQEFVGQGLSNMVGSFFSGYVSTGSFNRSGLNFQAGAQTPVAAILAGVFLMLIVLLVAPLAAFLPKAAMAGILMLVAWGLIDFREINHIFHSSRRETSIFLLTFLGAIFIELEVAIFVGVILSLVLYLDRTSKPKMLTVTPDVRLPERPFSHEHGLAECPQLKLVAVEGSLFFGSVNHFHDVMEKCRAKHPDQKHLALIGDGINFVDMQGGEALVEETRTRRKHGGDLYLINVKPGLWDAMEKFGCFDKTGIRNVFQSKKAAIRGIYNKLDKEKCKNCTVKLFDECKQ